MKPASAGFISKSDFFTFRENATAETISSSKLYVRRIKIGAARRRVDDNGGERVRYF